MKALLVLVALCRVASADDPDDSGVTHAGEANLESKDSRQGIQLSGALGGGLAIGFRLKDANGTGGRISLRLGEPMTPNWVLTVEIAGGGQLHRDATTMPQTHVDNDTNLLVGAQYYPSDSFFVRVAAGIGGYMQSVAARDSVDHRYAGPAVAFGAGLEIIKLKHLTFDFELFSISLATRDGLLATTALCFGATIH